jgi:SAM-dependent methyltransferase
MNYRDDLAHIHHAGFSEFAESAAPGLLELLWQRDIRDGLIVELGCGSGILARELTRAGFDVLGFDASPSMVALARATAPKARFETGSFDAIEIPPCRAIVAMGEVLNYGDARRFIANAQADLLIFDIAERGSYPPYDVQHIAGDDWSVIAIKVSDGTRLTRTVETFRVVNGAMRRGKEVHELELYDRAEIRALLRKRGYRVTIRRSYRTRRLPKGHALFLADRERE